MLKILSYLNIFLAVAYFLLYLLNSTSPTILAMLLVFVYNALVLNTASQERKFTIVHYALGGLCVIFSGFLTYWTIHIFNTSVAHNYFGNTWLYITIGILFACSIVVQYVLLCLRRNIVNRHL